MDIIELKKRLTEALSEKILELAQLGKGRVLSVWVEAKHINEVALLLRNESYLGFSVLENFFVAQLDSAFLLSYYLRAPKTGMELILRASIVPPNPEGLAKAPSIREVWPMAEHQERESAELFGIIFYLGLSPADKKEIKHSFLPPGWQGFPFRKEYKFPESFSGIQHQRDGL